MRFGMLHLFENPIGKSEQIIREAWTRLAGLDHRRVLRSMELMQDKVIPKQRQSTPPLP